MKILVQNDIINYKVKGEMNYMNAKKILVGLVLASSLALGACGKEKGPENKTVETTTSSVVAPPKEEGITASKLADTLYLVKESSDPGAYLAGTTFIIPMNEESTNHIVLAAAGQESLDNWNKVKGLMILLSETVAQSLDETYSITLLSSTNEILFHAINGQVEYDWVQENLTEVQ